MKKIFLIIQLVALTVGLPSFAIVGGPYDNDNYSILDERNSFYQATFTFNNGNGYAYFTPDSQFDSSGLSLLGVTTSGSSTTTSTGAFSRTSLYTDNFGTLHQANRSVFYYKGITYVGSAFGSADLEGRTITGQCNASSDEGTTTAQLQSTGVGINQSVTSNQPIVSSNAGFIINCGYNCDITETSPTFKFSGSGEITIISPNEATTLSQLAYSGYSQLIDAIVQAVSSQSSTLFSIGNNNTFTQAQTAISQSLASLSPYLQGASLEASYEAMDKENLYVSGVRRYF